MTTEPAAGLSAPPKTGRVEAIDLARALALLAMAHYHLIWDLETFGYLDPGTAGSGWPKFYARSIASSFLFLVGVSLVLAHWPVFKPDKFLRRLATVVGAALLVSLGTYVAFPDAFVYYGILHSIAVSSVVALLFLRLPAPIAFVAGAAAVALPFYVVSPAFDPPWLIWTGLSERLPRSLDFVPFFPWFGPVLFGIAAGRLAKSSGLIARMAQWKPGENQKWKTALRPLDFIGRHSLAFYLLHQPVLIALVWSLSQIMPPDRTEAYLSSCRQGCLANQEAAMCERFCSCTAERLAETGKLDAVQTGRLDPASDPQIMEMARMCTASAMGDD
ncbi:MAG: hypothetical protein CML29_07950 [Rhizobiales bacterium]|nr:hypothetical protein [Hyphomicrobiales bacterium]MBA70005.1 hypothetical protein [Hyphomicrobiales bacterium]